MTMIFDGLYAETYRVAIGLPVSEPNADCGEFPALRPTHTRTNWASIVVAWIGFSGASGEPEFQFPSDYWLGP